MDMNNAPCYNNATTNNSDCSVQECHHVMCVQTRRLEIEDEYKTTDIQTDRQTNIETHREMRTDSRSLHIQTERDTLRQVRAGIIIMYNISNVQSASNRWSVTTAR